jgi:hypothetical protein
MKPMPVLSEGAAVRADMSAFASDGNADIDAEGRESDGAAEAALADAAADLWGLGDATVVRGAVVGRGVLCAGVELPTVMSEFPLL